MKFSTRTTALVAMSAMTLAACDPAVTGESRAKQGAVIGGIAGGLFGLTREGDNKLIKGAVGAGVGAAVGGIIGQELDRQAADLRSGFGSNEIRVINTGTELRVIMPQDILFAVDSDVVNSSLRADLAVLANNLLDYPNSTVDIIGHTDSTGDAAHNQDLSNRRAQSVRFILIDNGVSGSRLRAFGRGETEPVASNLTAEGRQQNRRVEIIIRPTAR